MKNPAITQEEIGMIKRAQAGDESAFSELFKRYKSFVEGVLYQYLKDKDEAKDITNIVFLKVHQKLSLFNEYDSFGGWLRIITKNTAIDYIRGIKNKATILGDLDARLAEDNSNDNTEEDLANQMTYDRIVAEFKNFPKQSQTICERFYVDNLTVDQISDALNIPTGTVKSTLFRARKQIKKLFNKLKL